MARGHPTTIQQRLHEFPPIVCRLLARETVHGRGTLNIHGLTDDQIAKASGLALCKVFSISWLPSWDDVTCSDMLAFTKGCGIHFDDYKLMEKHSKYLSSKPAWKYLKRSPVDWNGRWRGMIELQRLHYQDETAE